MLPVDVLDRLDRLNSCLVGVEGAVSVRQRRALGEGDGDATLLRDGAGGRQEGEGDSEQRGLAEHGRC